MPQALQNNYFHCYCLFLCERNDFPYSLNQFCWSYSCLAVFTGNKKRHLIFNLFFVVFKNTTINNIYVFVKIIIILFSLHPWSKVQSYHRNGKQIELSHKTFKFCVIDQSVFMIFLINKMTQQSRGHTKLCSLKKKWLFSLNVLSCILSYFLKTKKKKSSGCKHSTILQNPKGCTSNIRHKDMLGLVQGKSCFLFCDLDIYLMSCPLVFISGRWLKSYNTW